MFLRQLGNLCRWLMFTVPSMSIRIFSVFHPQELETLIVSNLKKPERGVIKHIAFVSLVATGTLAFSQLNSMSKPFQCQTQPKANFDQVCKFPFCKILKNK